MQHTPYKMWPMATRHFSMLLLMLLVTIAGCKDVFEEDLSDVTVTLISPGNGVETDQLQQLFSWEFVEDAIDYRIQIVKPNFAAIEKLELDSFTVNTNYSITLTPGVYEWRVKAFNGSSETAWTTSSFSIDSTNNISSITVQLESPNIYSNESRPTFSWEDIDIAEYYLFEIYENSFDGGNSILPIQKTSTNSLRADDDLEEGTYEWGVSAASGLNQTLVSIQTLVIDQTDPTTPNLEEPEDDAISSDTTGITFSWQDPQDNGSPLRSYLEIYNNASGTDRHLSDTTSDFSSIQDLDAGIYYWRVYFEDRASNEGNASELFKLTVN